jgi:nucleoid-associated protein YgaU
MPKTPLQQAAKNPEFIGEHTIASGDTLSYISLIYYGYSSKSTFMILYEANKDVIADNPNMISAGKVLRIPKLEK